MVALDASENLAKAWAEEFTKGGTNIFDKFFLAKVTEGRGVEVAERPTQQAVRGKKRNGSMT